MFRKIALNILQRDTTVKSSLRGKRLQAGWNNDVLEAILTGCIKKLRNYILRDEEDRIKADDDLTLLKELCHFRQRRKAEQQM